VRYRDVAGRYDAEALARIARFFRSRDDGEVGEVSLRLIELIDYVQDHYHPATTTLLSGYRSPALNQRLRDGGAQAADSSLHIDGIAADLLFTGVDLKQLWIELREQRIGGVGYYAEQGFLHLDTGRPRFWEPQTSRVNERLSAGNARVFARTDFDRYRNLSGAIVRLHSVTALPLRLSTSGRVGPDTLVLAPLDDTVAVADDCIAFATAVPAYRLRIARAPDVALKQRAPIVLRTCAPRVEATPETIETNLIEMLP
jgi:uncharacterized protein YcbK (DUF882 family)